MREKEFELLTERARQAMWSAHTLPTVFEDSAALLEDHSAQEAAVLALASLSGHLEELQDAQLALATALHSQGVPYRKLGDATGVTAMTVRRHVERYKIERGIK